jgi:hypothetical protein
MTMHQIFVPGTNLHRNDMPRNTSSKRDLAGSANGAILRHKQRAAARNTLDRAKEAAATSVLRMGGHLNRGRHPREFTGL